MNLHKTTGRWKLGLLLSLMATLLWGVLPIALKAVLEVMDAGTITWYRFLAAAVVLGVFVWRRGGLPALFKVRGRWIARFAFAAVCLCSNYVLFLVGLDHLTPGAAQIVIQLAPVFLLLGGLIVYRERFNALQWTGLAILLSGMALFFNNRLDEVFSGASDAGIGVLLIVASAALWGAYGLAQKQLLIELPSGTIMFVLYVFGSVVLFPIAGPGQIGGLDATSLLLLAFCALNTILAYGCFAEALNHWEASRISAVLATTPLVSLVAVHAGTVLFPGFMEWDDLNALSVTGALLVVGGSILCALSGMRRGVRADATASGRILLAPGKEPGPMPPAGIPAPRGESCTQ